jgi:aspartate kinase
MPTEPVGSTPPDNWTRGAGMFSTAPPGAGAAVHSTERTQSGIAVIKVGGSVLTGRLAYRQTAEFVASRRSHDSTQPVVVVVSAERGVTDALLETAMEISPHPDSGTLDLLWSTGELRSVALLALALQAIDVRAAALNVHQTGLMDFDGGDSAESRGFRHLRLRALLATYDVVVAPGFLARGAGDSIVSLGRGGSDLSAVLLAAGLGADVCELVKDVPGYFVSDPRSDPLARHLPALDYATAIAMADRGCALVQRQALEAAHFHGITLIIRSLGSEQRTMIQ